MESKCKLILIDDFHVDVSLLMVGLDIKKRS